MRYPESDCLTNARPQFGIQFVASARNEPLNSGYIIVAALCTYTIGFRFYAKWIAARVLTPARVQVRLAPPEPAPPPAPLPPPAAPPAPDGAAP